MNREEKRFILKHLQISEFQLDQLVQNRESLLRILHGNIDDWAAIPYVMSGEFRGERKDLTHELLDTMTLAELQVTFDSSIRLAIEVAGGNAL